MTKSATNQIIFINKLGFLKIDFRTYISSKSRAFRRKRCRKRSARDSVNELFIKVTILSDWTIFVVYLKSILFGINLQKDYCVYFSRTHKKRVLTLVGTCSTSNTRRKTRTSQSDSHFATFEHNGPRFERPPYWNDWAAEQSSEQLHQTARRERLPAAARPIARRRTEKLSCSHGAHPIEDNGHRSRRNTLSKRSRRIDAESTRQRSFESIHSNAIILTSRKSQQRGGDWSGFEQLPLWNSERHHLASRNGFEFESSTGGAPKKRLGKRAKNCEQYFSIFSSLFLFSFPFLAFANYNIYLFDLTFVLLYQFNRFFFTKN